MIPNQYLFLAFLLPLGISCQDMPRSSKYLKSVGDIAYDSTVDKPDFHLCNEQNIMQYHNNYKGLEYEGEKIAIVEAFSKKFIPVPNNKESGLVRIRFVVNCKGDSDRFRATAMDENYQEKTFDDAIIQQLLTITKELNAWIPKKDKDQSKEMDYYQYLIFKIEQGKIVEIMP